MAQVFFFSFVVCSIGILAAVLAAYFQVPQDWMMPSLYGIGIAAVLTVIFIFAIKRLHVVSKAERWLVTVMFAIGCALAAPVLLSTLNKTQITETKTYEAYVKNKESFQAGASGHLLTMIRSGEQYEITVVRPDQNKTYRQLVDKPVFDQAQIGQRLPVLIHTGKFGFEFVELKWTP